VVVRSLWLSPDSSGVNLLEGVDFSRGDLDSLAAEGEGVSGGTAESESYGLDESDG
jgi:hypothetical protein